MSGPRAPGEPPREPPDGEWTWRWWAWGLFACIGIPILLGLWAQYG